MRLPAAILSAALLLLAPATADVELDPEGLGDLLVEGMMFSFNVDP